MLKPTPKEPVFNVPGAVLGLLVVLAGIQLWQSLLTPQAVFDLLARFAFVPLRLTAEFDGSGVASRVSDWAASNQEDLLQRAELARFFLQGGLPPVVTLLTYAFLHGGWVHVGLNGVWLLAFGSPLARRFGTVRFLGFLALAAVLGGLAHWLCFPWGAEPVVGASAAVSGCMGAALRFAFRAPEPLRPSGEAVNAPPLSLFEVFTSRRALSFLIVWFLSNALFGVGSESFGLSDAPVAWQAHIGGFLAGLLLFRLFDPPHPPPEAVPDDIVPPPLAP